MSCCQKVLLEVIRGKKNEEGVKTIRLMDCLQPTGTRSISILRDGCTFVMETGGVMSELTEMKRVNVQHQYET